MKNAWLKRAGSNSAHEDERHCKAIIRPTIEVWRERPSERQVIKTKMANERDGESSRRNREESGLQLKEKGK